MKTFLAALAIAAVALVPVTFSGAAQAQNYEDLVLHHSYDPAAKNQKRNPDEAAQSIYGESQNDAEAMGGGDATGQEETGDDNQQSYDQQALGEDAPQDIYGYVAGQTKMSATERREATAKKANDAALKSRAAALKKMQTNSENLLKKQKERAWKLAHPGKEYPGEESEDGDGSEETAYSPGDGDSPDADSQDEDENQDQDGEEDSQTAGQY